MNRFVPVQRRITVTIMTPAPFERIVWSVLDTTTNQISAYSCHGNYPTERDCQIAIDLSLKIGLPL